MNLRIRTLVLEYSLKTENNVNNLLLGYLSIFDKEKTKNFGNKAGISFKNKIDLLFDIDVLNKKEHQDLELLMNFRNKFMHDIESESFTYILNKLDSGIRNRFLKFSLSKEIKNEIEYEKAFDNLYLQNLKVIEKKYRERRENIKERTNYLISLYDGYESMSNMGSDLAGKIMEIIKKIDFKNTDSVELSEKILRPCLEFTNNYEKEAERMDFILKRFESLPKNKMIL
ncbi:hypothetical protein G1K37_11300 [Tenacibaculum dicentrarchi]|nr:hypothetical protein [Tenacibaculum dicentrarchi]